MTVLEMDCLFFLSRMTKRNIKTFMYINLMSKNRINMKNKFMILFYPSGWSKYRNASRFKRKYNLIPHIHHLLNEIVLEYRWFYRTHH